MINLIELIFDGAGYSRADYPNDFDARLYRRTGALQDEFFIVKDFSTESSQIIDELQSDIYLSLAPFFSLVEGAEKNTNLILMKCHPAPTNAQATLLNRKISEIEENPYFFKKSVLAYTIEEMEALSSKILETPDKNLATTIEEVMHNYEDFIEFRDHNTNPLFSVVTKLYTKLPFLTYNLKPEDQIQLGNEIDQKLQLKNLYTIRDEALELDIDSADALEAWIASSKEDKNV
ncbi:ABC-three component system middle component 1 [Pseudomonas nunensis]|uniref:Uncharacterized protein n=1 Tax=Pseudomonas nunensis TaxID=2961896 RepID=A0ABY5EI96_9PSED|nr:ABC-three component system middle component 1 [Pseudomonas nunensis]KPN93461.1 hypothetical protein AL066_00990 [Pseudomonas nunensis]MCL5228137.1 hypothetical protein [Pseudomonas nunensis]UTO14981.1 hypothetical protein NK667_01035 [Pseudomonas nunensis]